MIAARLRLFADLQLTPGPDPHAHPLHISSPHTQTLLAYLALHSERPVDRHNLAYLLWADFPETTARSYLRQHLHRLRALLTSLDIPETVLTSRANELYFRPYPHLWIDVLAFQQQINDRTWQVAAIELYRGDLLAGDNASWLQPIQTQLQEQYMEALRSQIQLARLQRNYARAEHYAQLLLEVNPLRESSQRIYMEVLYLGGKRVQAIRQYQQLKELLQRELNVDPMPQTTELYEQIRAGVHPQKAPAVPASRHLAAPVLQKPSGVPPSFIGRRDELAHLDEALAQALMGRGQMVLVEGESGVGKTELLRTWQQMRAAHMLAFQAECEASHLQGPAGISLSCAMRQGAGQIDWKWFPAQLNWLPAARQQIATGRSLPPVDENVWRQFLLALASRAGEVVCLLFDDLHFADETTWKILAFLGRRCGRMALLLAGSYEPNLLPDRAAHLIRTLKRERNLVQLRLWPFSPADTAHLAQSVCGEKFEQGFLNRLYRTTEGNPFFIAELLKTMQITGASPASYLKGDYALPPTILAMVNRRLQTLSAQSRAILYVAAELGRRFRFASLAQVMPSSDEDDILLALDSWLQAGLIREREEGYEFAHEQFRRAVLQLGQDETDYLGDCS